MAGNRLWLRDGAGDEFLYSHLSAFSLLVKKGAHVRAGQVIGFMGNTGDAEGRSTHLHLEVHPLSLLFLGADGAVDPVPYLRGWRRLESLSVSIAAGWAPKVPGTIQAPPSGRGVDRLDRHLSADGLDPSTLRRLAPAPEPCLSAALPERAGGAAGRATVCCCRSGSSAAGRSCRR